MARFILEWNGRDLSNVGWEDFTISKNFVGEQQDVDINLTEVEIKGSDAVDLRARALNGLNGGVGIFEGDPVYLKVLDEKDNLIHAIDLYIDFASNFKILAPNHVSMSLKKRKSVQWLEDVAVNKSFSYMYDTGIIKNSDFVRVPYVINYVPDGTQLLFLSVTLFIMAKELYESIKAIAESIANLIDSITPVVGVGVGLGAVAVTAWDIGNIIFCALAVAFNIAYTIAITYAIIKLLEEIFEQLMPKLRHHLGIRVQRLFELGAQAYGLQLQSTLLAKYSNWVLIPTKDHKGGLKPEGFKGQWTELGIPTSSDGLDNFADLIRFFRQMFIADFKIQNNRFIFETVGTFKSQGVWNVPEVFTNQEALEDEVSFNTDEVVSNYVVRYSTDIEDKNTVDNQQGMKFQAILEPINSVNSDLSNIKNLVDIEIGATLGVRKDSLTVIEKVLKELAKVVDALTFGATSFASKVDARIGSLLTSTHYLQVPKLVAMQGSKLAPNQREIFDAEKIYDEYHSASNMVDVNGKHNQYRDYPEHTIPFGAQDFLTLLNNNYGFKDGKSASIENIVWTVDKGTAEIKLRVNEKYTNNLKIKRLKS